MKKKIKADETLKDFNYLMDEQIKRVQKGLAVQTEVMVLKDMKRLAKIGAFVLEEDEPIFKLDDNTRYEVSKRVRLKWQGEEELKRLKKENENLLDRIIKLREILNGEI